MRRFLGYALLSLVAGVAAAPPAPACINDSEVENAEREFKSNYNSQPAAPTDSNQSEGSGNFMTYGGTLLLIGAAVVTLRKPSRAA